MTHPKKAFVMAIIGAVMVLAMVGGTWTSSLGAPLSQDTVSTREPADTPTPVPTRVRPPAGPVPLIFIVSVDPDKTVTIRTANFPKNVDFDVLMNFYGTLGIGGQKVATVNSGAGGVLSWTFNIPDFLKGSSRIAIRLQGTGGYFSFNWFWNSAAGTGTPPGQPVRKIPTFKIMAVEKDKTVTIETADFPASDKFDVLMNRYGTLGIGGTKIQTVDSGAGGKLTFTFNIPDGLKGLDRIAIRLQSPTSGYYAYNWFWNNSTAGSGSTTPPPTTPSLPHGVIPTFKIQSVVKDGKVTILTSNLPAGDQFKVTMNDYGTRGIGGTVIQTVDSGAGGALTFTFDIPDTMKGKQRIAIRLESSASGYFAYNWFWNNTYP